MITLSAVVRRFVRNLLRFLLGDTTQMLRLRFCITGFATLLTPAYVFGQSVGEAENRWTISAALLESIHTENGPKGFSPHKVAPLNVRSLVVNPTNVLTTPKIRATPKNAIQPLEYVTPGTTRVATHSAAALMSSRITTKDS